jgi:hypothetical protein
VEFLHEIAQHRQDRIDASLRGLACGAADVDLAAARPLEREPGAIAAGFVAMVEAVGAIAAPVTPAMMSHVSATHLVHVMTLHAVTHSLAHSRQVLSFGARIGVGTKRIIRLRRRRDHDGRGL